MEKIKEEIKYFTEWLRFVVLAVVAVTSSMFSFIVAPMPAITKVPIIVLHVFCIFVFAIVIILLDTAIVSKFKKL